MILNIKRSQNIAHPHQTNGYSAFSLGNRYKYQIEEFLKLLVDDMVPIWRTVLTYLTFNFFFKE